MLRAALLLSAVLASCAHATGEKPTTNKSSAMSRPITPRAKLPAAIQPLLPKHGVYVAGGGLVSSAWRIVIDLDARTIYAGTADRSNAPSFGPMDKESTKELSPRNQELLMGLANAAWAEPPATDPPRPTADYDEIFVVLEGDDTFFLEGFGPIRQPAAAKAIVEIRAAAGL